MKLIYLAILIIIACLVILACGADNDKTYTQQHKDDYLVSDTAEGVKIEKDKTR